MQVSVTVSCPECGASDVTNVEVDEFDTYVTTQCVECTNPYAIRVELRSITTAYKLVKVNDNA